MNDFATLNGSVVNGTVVLTWNLHGISAVNGKTVVSNVVQRSPTGVEQWATLATSTGTDFAGATYTDQLPAEGDYQYRLILTVGIAPNITVLHSNIISANLVTSVTLTGSVNGAVVSLDWGGAGNAVGYTGEVESATVERSADGGAHYFPVRNRGGRLSSSYVETLSQPGTYLYRVKVSFENPELPDALGVDQVITSNVVSITATF
jgi:hypothetical protein